SRKHRLRTKTELALSGKIHRIFHGMVILRQTSVIISLCIHSPHIHTDAVTSTTSDHTGSIQLARIPEVQSGDLPGKKRRASLNRGTWLVQTYCEVTRRHRRPCGLTVSSECQPTTVAGAVRVHHRMTGRSHHVSTEYGFLNCGMRNPAPRQKQEDKKRYFSHFTLVLLYIIRLNNHYRNNKVPTVKPVD